MWWAFLFTTKLNFSAYFPMLCYLSAAGVILNLHPGLLYFFCSSASIPCDCGNSLSSLPVCWSVFSPLTTFFPILFLLSRQVFQPSSTCSLAKFTLSRMNNTLFVSKTTSTALFFFCALLCALKIEKIGNFQHSHPRIFKHQRCRLLQMHALFVCWPTRVAAPRVLCIVAGA